MVLNHPHRKIHSMETINLDKLTKKNQEFIHIATNRLMENGMSDEAIKTALSEILPVILENQTKGLTARQIYHAPTVWADSLTTSATTTDVKPKNTNPRLMLLDAILFVLGLMGLATGIMTLIGRSPDYGLITLIGISLSTGAMMYALYHYFYQHLNKPRHERPMNARTWLKVTGLMVIFAIFFSLLSLIPDSINPKLPVWLTILIGASAFALRYYLQKRYNVKSPVTSRD